MKLGRGWDGGGRAASKSRPLESHKMQSMPAAVLWDAAEGCSSTEAKLSSSWERTNDDIGQRPGEETG